MLISMDGVGQLSGHPNVGVGVGVAAGVGVGSATGAGTFVSSVLPMAELCRREPVSAGGAA